MSTKYSYLPPNACANALARMQRFHDDLVALYKSHRMELLSNLGRRNIVMSQPMEEFFAHELAKELDGHVECDGRTGKADIVIHSLGKELECKLNTPHGKRSHSLQADWVTVGKKGCLDFLYLIADTEFQKFAVLHFSGLEQKDFHPPSPGSRNKVRIRLDQAMGRCSVLHGEAVRINGREIEKIDAKIADVDKCRRARLLELGSRIRKTTAPRRREQLTGVVSREKARFDKKERKLQERRQMWQSRPGKWTFELAQITED